MTKRDQPPISSEGQWRTVAELSLRGELGCEHEAMEKLAEILVSIHIPDRVLVEAKQTVSRIMEKEMSHIVADQAKRTFTILVRTQFAQSLEMSVNEAGHRELHSRSRGWGFFLTEKRISETELSNAVDQVVINVYLYQEGHPV